MSTSTAVEDQGPRRYGNWRRPARPGVLGYSMIAAVMAFLGVVIAMFTLLLGGGIVPASVIIVLTMVALSPTRRSSRDGRSTYERFWKRMANRRNRHAGKDVSYGGPAGFLPDGKFRLPGLLTASELITVHDSLGEPFGVLCVRATAHYTIVFECAATGQELNDQSVVDREVAQWGQFMAELGGWADVDGGQVVVETAPDPGDRLQAMVRAKRSPNAPEFATRVTEETIQRYPVGASTIHTRVSLTFSARSMAAEGSGSVASRDEMLARIGNRLPAIISGLRVTGAGQSVRVMKAEDLVDAVRVAFDPAAAAHVDQARREGGTMLAWDEAGPQRWEPHDDYVWHDRAFSVSYQMLEPPRGAVYSDVLTTLLAPHPDIRRKRIALLFRPQDSVSAAETVERDVNETQFTATSGRRPSARNLADLRAARQAADEESKGAGLVRFGMIITATVDRKEDLPLAQATVRRLTASSRLRVRECLGNQAVAFTASLPCGLVLPKHMRIPDGVQDML